MINNSKQCMMRLIYTCMPQTLGSLFSLLFAIFSSQMQQRMRFMELCNAANNIFNDDDDDLLFVIVLHLSNQWLIETSIRIYLLLIAVDQNSKNVFVSWMLLLVIDLVFVLHMPHVSVLNVEAFFHESHFSFCSSCFAVTGRMADTLREDTIHFCSMDSLKLWSS